VIMPRWRRRCVGLRSRWSMGTSRSGAASRGGVFTPRRCSTMRRPARRCGSINPEFGRDRRRSARRRTPTARARRIKRPAQNVTNQMTHTNWGTRSSRASSPDHVEGDEVSPASEGVNPRRRQARSAETAHESARPHIALWRLGSYDTAMKALRPTPIVGRESLEARAVYVDCLMLRVSQCSSTNWGVKTQAHVSPSQDCQFLTVPASFGAGAGAWGVITVVITGVSHLVEAPIAA